MEAFGRSCAEALKGFIDNSPTPYHAVSFLGRMLYGHGFQELKENNAWQLLTGGKYFVTRNGSSIIAFRVGDDCPPANFGFRIIGAHTDSPNLRLKPRAVFDKAGYIQFAVEPYGGLILASWLNRDLGLAGRVVVRKKDGSLCAKLVRCDRPILSIPQLAIHLNRDVNERGLILNPQLHLAPIVGLVQAKRSSAEQFQDLLRHLLRGDLEEGDIISMDLALYDTEESKIGGLNHEFIYAARLDNLASCHAATRALVMAENTSFTPVVAFYDHEEVGSESAEGAQSPFLKDVLERINNYWLGDKEENFKRAIANSFCISADMAHAAHPNYLEKHDSQHMPVLGGGPVIKTNVNQRYATNDLSTAFFVELCHRAKVPYQNFVSRSDLACGSTIGPITATRLGITTVDVGSPMLSMHAIREQAAVVDHQYMTEVLTEFFNKETTNLKV